MTGLRRLGAAIVIFGVVTPSGAGAAAAAHALFEHGSSGIDAASLAVSFHGHRHSSDAPDHDHALIKPSSPARVVDRAVAAQSVSECRAVVAAPGLVAVSCALGRPPLTTGSGPPQGISPLRV